MRAGYEGGVAAGMDMQRWLVRCRGRGAVSSEHGGSVIESPAAMGVIDGNGDQRRAWA